MADATAELLKEVRRDADRLTADLGFEPELLTGVVQLDAGPDDGLSEQGAPTALHDRPREAPAAAAAEEPTDAVVDEPGGLGADIAAGESQDAGTAEPIDAGTGDAVEGGSAQSEDALAAESGAAMEQESDRKSAGDGGSEEAVVVDGESADTSEATSSTPCSHCDTSGHCPRCSGKGRRFVFRCKECRGSGRCTTCGGAGFIWTGPG